jgi:hypothetical protein
MTRAGWDFAAAGIAPAFPKRVRADVPRKQYRARKWAMRGRVMRWMIRTGYQQANRHYSHHGDEQAARHIVGPLELIAAARAADTRGILDWRNQDTWVTLDAYELRQTAELAARIVEQQWTPAFIDTCSLAGRVSRRGPTFTLEAYADVAHMPQSLAARALGCSVATIKRLRAQAKAAGSALKAAALAHARRARPVVLRPFSWYQLTKTRVVQAPALTAHQGQAKGGAPP